MRIAILQIGSRAGAFEPTVDRMLDRAAAVAAQGAELAVFPLPLLTGPNPGGFTQEEGCALDLEAALSRLAAAAPLPLVVPMVVSSPSGTAYETALVRDGAVERLVADAADPARPAGFTLSGVDFGVACDRWALDDVARGAGSFDVVLYLSPYGCNTNDESSALAPSVGDGLFEQEARGADAWLVAVGGVGGYDEQVFCGGSFVMAPWGELAAAAPSFVEASLACDVDVVSEGPLASPAAPPPYQRLPFLWDALALSVRDLVAKAGLEGAALELDGGLRSAALAALLVDALGPTRVRAVIGCDDRKALEDARALARNLRISAEEVPEARALSEAGLGAADLARALVAARCREGRLAHASHADKTGLALEPWREAAGGCAVVPFGDVYRTDLVELARHRNAVSPVIPRRSLRRLDVPELGADVAPMAPVALLNSVDAVLLLHVERRMGVTSIAQERRLGALAEAVVSRVQGTEALRRAIPACPVVSDRTLAERDWPLDCAWTDRMRDPAELEAAAPPEDAPGLAAPAAPRPAATEPSAATLEELGNLLRDLFSGTSGGEDDDGLFDSGLFSRN